MAATSAPQVDSGYARLYENIAFFPELGRFRRFAAQWGKLLHDDMADVLEYRDEVTKELRKDPAAPSGVTLLDIPRSVMRARHGDIYNTSWKLYEEALRQYGNDLCTSQQIMNFPGQATYATKHLAEYNKVPFFEKDVFAVTGEDESFHLGPSELNDGCAWRALPQIDYLGEKVVEVAPWIEKHVQPWIEKHILRHFRSTKDRKDKSSIRQTDPPHHRYHAVVESLDILTCILVSLLLTGTMFALAHTGPLDARLGVVGALGTVFSVSVKLLAGSPSRRIEMYAATAAFFAVATVFVSNTGSGDIGC